MGTEQQVKIRANRTGLTIWPAPAGLLRGLFLLLIVASCAALVVACGSDPTPTPEPTPEPTATATPTATPEPEPVNEDDAVTRA